MYQNFIIPYLYEAQHVTWKVFGRVVGGLSQAQFA
jgi:hypothetical protein